jgi:uncharacterized RDD family membrane protein YckC
VCLFYDGLLLVPVLFISSYLFLTLTQPLQGTAAHRPLFQAWICLVLGVYFVYCWTRSGQTLAMKTWRIRVVRQDGGLVEMRRALVRYVIALVGTLLVGVTFWWALFDRARLFLHDRLAGTRLVYEPLAAAALPTASSSDVPAAGSSARRETETPP